LGRIGIGLVRGWVGLGLGVRFGACFLFVWMILGKPRTKRFGMDTPGPQASFSLFFFLRCGIPQRDRGRIVYNIRKSESIKIMPIPFFLQLSGHGHGRHDLTRMYRNCALCSSLYATALYMVITFGPPTTCRPSRTSWLRLPLRPRSAAL